VAGELSYEKLLKQCLQGELRVLNAHIPRQQKSLPELLGEEYPHVVCSDGNAYLFKRKELKYLAEMLDTQEQKALFLPMLVELGESHDEVTIICKTGVEETVVSKVLGMPLSCKEGRIRIYKSQLGVVRKALRTTTQYIFTAKIPA
jgi:uncharacterized protein (UPF0216 family)